MKSASLKSGLALVDSIDPGATFKSTPIGPIPHDWELSSLREVCSSICDGTHFTPTYVSNGVPFYSVENVTQRDFANCKFISQEEHAHLIKRCRPERGDILMTRITAGVVGDTWLLDWDVNASIYVSLALLKPSKRIVPEYLYRYTKSPTFVASVEKRALTNATPKKINMGDIGAVPVPLPPSAREQQAIAQALSDADALIESQEQLIAKKRAIKQGAMQELLTGKRRLPGFKGEWETNALGGLFTFSGGLSASRDQLGSSGLYYLHYGDIHAAEKTYIDVDRDNGDIPRLDVPIERVNRVSLLSDGDVVFVDASEDDEGASKHVVVCNASGQPFISGLHTIVARSRSSKLDNGFKRYCFQSQAIRNQFKFYAVGTKVTGVSKSNIAKIVLSYPDLKEQAAISEILDDIDSQIECLGIKLAKARRVKQGMMQELLTGRIRLV